MSGEFQQIAEGEEYIGNLDLSIQTKNFELMKDSFPASFDKLREVKNIVEDQLKNMLQIDFTLENGTVYILNIHSSKMSPVASVKVAVDMVHEKIMNERQALKTLELKQLEFFLHNTISPTIDLNELNRKLIGKGASLSAGCVVGKVALSLSDVNELKALNENVIYCFDNITKDDSKIFKMVDAIISLIQARDYLTTFYIPSLPPTINNFNKLIRHNDSSEDGESKDSRQVIKKGQTLTADATTGRVFAGSLELVNLFENSDFQTVLSWSRKYKSLKVYGDFGNLTAPSLSFSRIEHQEFGFDGLGMSMATHVTQMYLSLTQDDSVEMHQFLIELQTLYSNECVSIMKQSPGLPISFRLMDVSSSHKKSNLKGCQELVLNPDLTIIQVEAIMSAVISSKETNRIIEMSIPGIFSKGELVVIINDIHRTARRVISSHGDLNIQYKINCVLECPEALIQAHTFAYLVDSITFNTEAITEKVYGCSRGDSWIDHYIHKNVFSFDPFQRIDEKSVGIVIS